MQVTYFHRRPRGTGNYSIEFVFAEIRALLGNEIEARAHLAPYFSNGLFRRLAIVRDARRHQGQVNHVTGDINFAVLGLDPRRTILTNHDCGCLDGTRGLRRWLLKLIWLDLPCKRARYVTTVSEAARVELLSHVSCDPAKVVVIYNPIAESFEYQAQTFSTSKPRILQVGTASNKNIPRLVQALQGIACTLVIVGVISEELKSSLRAADVEFENYVNCTSDEMLEHYRRADLVAFASTFEGFGLPIVEANAVGRPVVTSNVSSMPEVAGDAACLVDPFDVASIRAGIQRVIGDAAFRKQLIENGRINRRRFQADVIASQYLALYETIASELGPANVQQPALSVLAGTINYEP